MSEPQMDDLNSEFNACMFKDHCVAMARDLAALQRERDNLRQQVITGIYDAASVGTTIIKTEVLDALKRELDEAKQFGVHCYADLVAAAPKLAAQLRAASEMITEYRADLDACKAVSVALQRHISQLERALIALKAYVEETEDAKFEDVLNTEAEYQKMPEKEFLNVYHPKFLEAVSIVQAALAGKVKP